MARQGSPFWEFSLRVYGLPGVPAACLVLQDAGGADVNVALALLYLGANGRALSAADVALVDGAVADWRREIVVPLREVRRALNSREDDPAVVALRRQVKQVELESERLQQEALYAAIAGLGLPADPASAAQANLALYADLLGGEFAPPAVDALVSASLK